MRADPLSVAFKSQQLIRFLKWEAWLPLLVNLRLLGKLNFGHSFCLVDYTNRVVSIRCLMNMFEFLISVQDFLIFSSVGFEPSFTESASLSFLVLIKLKLIFCYLAIKFSYSCNLVLKFTSIYPQVNPC